MWKSAHQTQHEVQARFRGCLLGGAVGDALGAPVEFLTKAHVQRRFGPAGITTYAPAYGGLGTITDDTQMTLFTAEGLIRGWVRGCLQGVTSYPAATATAYQRWLTTQDGRTHHDTLVSGSEAGWLIQQPQLHSLRAPGNTCLSALRAAREGNPGPANNGSKGCGGVMRVAPVGLFSWRTDTSIADAFRLGVEIAALTHGHPTGTLTAGVLAVLIMGLADGASLSETLAVARTLLRMQPGHAETLDAIEVAEALAAAATAPDRAIARLGQGWTAEEALAISLYCALVARDFREGVILAVNHDGDSDSTGAITGNLLGTWFGVDAIPSQWLTPLELRDVIAELADDLYACKDWKLGDAADVDLTERIRSKYPAS